MRIPLLALAVAACGSNPSQSDVDASSIDTTDVADATATIDPAYDGPHAIMRSNVTIAGHTNARTLAATLVTPVTPGPRPLVVISPGFQMARTQYTSYANHLASWGFVVVLTDYAESGFVIDHQKIANDITSVIDWALAQSALEIDEQRVAAAGHSLGGKISTFAASQDARIKAVVGWDPVDSSNPSVVPEKVASIQAAIAVVGETTNGSGNGMPCAPTAENFQTFYAAAGSPALALTVVDADHMDWIDDPSCALCGFCKAGAAPADRARMITRRVNVAWLRRQLYADTSMDVWLDSPPEVAAGLATVARR